jgi:hypothetical protein
VRSALRLAEARALSPFALPVLDDISDDRDDDEPADSDDSDDSAAPTLATEEVSP